MWNISPGTGLTAFHKSFDLILASTLWEACHYLHLTVDDIEAQRGQVAVQGNLVARLGWNSSLADSTNHHGILLPASTAGSQASGLNSWSEEHGFNQTGLAVTYPHIWGGCPT